MIFSKKKIQKGVTLCPVLTSNLQKGCKSCLYTIFAYSLKNNKAMIIKLHDVNKTYPGRCAPAMC